MNGRILVGASLVALSFVGMEGGCKAKGTGIGGGGSGGTSGVTATVTNGSQANTGTQATTAQGFSTTGQTTGPTTVTSTSNAQNATAQASTTADVATTTAAATTGNGMTTVSSTTTTNGATTTAGTTTSASTGTGTCKVITPHAPGAAPDSLYCPFGSPTTSCDPSMDHCCEPPKSAMMPSTCAPIGTSCGTNFMGTDWGCADPVADCPSGSVCCSNVGATVGPKTGCPQELIATNMTQTRCMSSCPANTLELCTGSGSGDCTGGKMCVGFEHAGADIGYCK